MTVKLLTEVSKFLSLKGQCTGSSESTLVKIPHCWQLRVTAHILNVLNRVNYTNCDTCAICSGIRLAFSVISPFYGWVKRLQKVLR